MACLHCPPVATGVPVLVLSHLLCTPQPLPACSPQVLDPATVCSAKLPVLEAAILALSADQLLLACVSASTVRVYSLPHLLSHQSDLPVHTLQMEQPLLQFSWCPDAADSTQFLALTAGRVLLHGSLATGSATLAEHVECASWAPDGQHVAYSSGSRLVVTGVDWKDSAFKVDLPPPEGEGAIHRTTAATAAHNCNMHLYPNQRQQHAWKGRA